MNYDFMNIAFLEAEKAFKAGEVPIGAVIVKDGKVIAKAYNMSESKIASMLFRMRNKLKIHLEKEGVYI